MWILQISVNQLIWHLEFTVPYCTSMLTCQNGVARCCKSIFATECQAFGCILRSIWGLGVGPSKGQNVWNWPTQEGRELLCPKPLRGFCVQSMFALRRPASSCCCCTPCSCLRIRLLFATSWISTSVFNYCWCWGSTWEVVASPNFWSSWSLKRLWWDGHPPGFLLESVGLVFRCIYRSDSKYPIAAETRT